MDTAVCSAPQLSQPADADVVVVGSGIAGLSIAYELAGRGRKVIVVDRGEIGSGMTARTTAHLALALDDGFRELSAARGPDCARLYAQSVAAAIDRAETIQSTEHIDCDFRRVDGFLIPASGTPTADLDEERDCCRRTGVRVEDCHDPTPFQAPIVDAPNRARSLRFPGQARFHPTKYLAGLARALRQRGALLYANTCVDSIGQEQDLCVVKTTSGFEIRAQDVVVATNSPINVRVAIHTKQAPYRTYAMAARIPAGTVPDALYWDTLDPYHYVRLQPHSEAEDIVIFGGEDHKAGEANDGARRFAALEEWARERLPTLGDVTHRWSGQVMEPLDFVGFIGRSPGEEHVFVVSGDSGQGITNGLVAGLLIADLIFTGASPWESVYAPERKIQRNIGDFISENATALKNFAEYLTAGDLASLERLRPGDGRILRSGLKKLAACRDQNGKLHLHSASCTHMGCIVHWNSLEQCWDCPCHGSQFAPDGTALNGPAVSSLARVETTPRTEAAE